MLCCLLATNKIKGYSNNFCYKDHLSLKKIDDPQKEVETKWTVPPKIQLHCKVKLLCIKNFIILPLNWYIFLSKLLKERPLLETKIYISFCSSFTTWRDALHISLVCLLNQYGKRIKKFLWVLSKVTSTVKQDKF